MECPICPPARWRLLPLLLALALGSAACQEEKKAGLSGRFGPGSGGPALSGTLATVPLTKVDGGVVGYADYDALVFLPLGAQGADQIENLADAPDNLSIGISRISGRPDTPCRFQAALLARDQDFDILDSGDRKNDQNLDFHQVNLKHGAARLSLFCTALHSNVGVLVQVLADDAAKVDWVEVHALLNSIRKS
jgi:hypothetical protein